MHEWLEASLAELSKKSCGGADLKLRQEPREDHRLYRVMAGSSPERQPRHFHGSRPFPTRRRIAAAQAEARAAA